MTRRSVDSRIHREMRNKARAQDRAGGCRCPNVRYHVTVSRLQPAVGNEPPGADEVTVTGAPHAPTCPLRAASPVVHVPTGQSAPLAPVPSTAGSSLWTP